MYLEQDLGTEKKPYVRPKEIQIKSTSVNNNLFLLVI